MPTPKASRAAIYCRISQDREGAGLGVARQEKDCRELAERLGWTVAEVFVDNDLSAYSGKPRPGYRQLMAALIDGSVDGLLTWHGDRLHRSLTELETFIDAIQLAGTPVQTVQSGEINLSSPSGRLAARQVGAIARYESEHKSARVRRAMLQRAEAGQPVPGGTRGFGYSVGMEIVEQEAQVIKEMASLVLDQGYTAGQVARWANDAGHTTSAGGPWRPRSVNELLCSARIAGWRSHAPGLGSSSRERIFGLPFTNPGVWDAILDRDTVERLRHALTRNTTSRTKPNTRYLLSGILWHRGCSGDGRFVGVVKDGVARYRCSPRAPIGHGCGGPQIVAQGTEDSVAHALVSHLGSRLGREQRELQPESDAEPVLEAIRKARRAIERLGDQLDDEEITRNDYRRRKTRQEDKIAHLQVELEKHEATRRSHLVNLPWAQPTSDRSAFWRWWQSADLDARRAILKRYIDRVEVSPGVRGRKAYDKNRLTFFFTDGTAYKFSDKAPDADGIVGEIRLVVA